MSPGLTDLSASRMTPEMKLATIFCRPKPIPTPTAPEKIANAERSMPTALSAIDDREHDQGDADQLDQQHLDRRRQVRGAGDPALDEGAERRSSPTAPRSAARRADQEQRRQPQTRRHDRGRIRIQRVDGRLQQADDAERGDEPGQHRHEAHDERVADMLVARLMTSQAVASLARPRSDSCGSARSSGSIDDARRIIRTANIAIPALTTSTRHEVPQRRRPAHANEVEVDPCAARAAPRA